MKLRIGFSPCPNDTFIFDALVNKRIDTEGLEFEPVLEDVQTLNEWSNAAELDITKLSFPALFNNAETYVVLNAGSALGKGVGPLLITNKLVDVPDPGNSTIAIPGTLTTANFLLSYAFPMATNKVPMLFSKIEDALVNGTVDLGLIIHENRFTYQKKGLIKVLDLGEYWEEKTGLPIPLGCIAVKRSLDKEVQLKIDRLIRKSLEMAFEDYPAIHPYVKEHAQAMDEEVMRKHIELYVNNYSLDLGPDGKAAISKFYEIYSEQTGRKITGESLFLS